jgi:hypothetical protein
MLMYQQITNVMLSIIQINRNKNRYQIHQLFKLQKGCTRLAAASDKVYQLLAQGRWFSPGTLASSTTKTGHHDIAEILLKVALNTKNSNSIHSLYLMGIMRTWR